MNPTYDFRDRIAVCTDSRFPALMIGIGSGKVPPIPGGALEFR